MGKLSIRYIFFVILSVVLFPSCRTSQPATLYDPLQVADLSDRLGVELKNTDKEDDLNMPLYAEASLWLGVPYRYAGLSRKGLDCSGFTYLIYQKVYGIILPRSTSDLAKHKMHKVSKHNLRTGDLVFFSTSKNHNRINHVGIYLKDGFFIHASTSKGVIVSHINEDYYNRTWKKGGRIKT
ncbi:C40 family peptidase [Dysgonomonas sp. BGC7]|uniref:C40 family peptidase n=1 Tax=Dysgonomonas sp. BGC7 TaxID=1658008 RepID=UPI0006835C0D|nr:C40 family peptidase [Dysgonomonas sp. BGC7]MBD8389962.1 C40 family peptidase [Dysgonomonas sp. BGC7]